MAFKLKPIGSVMGPNTVSVKTEKSNEFVDFVNESGGPKKKGPSCWKGYKAVGKKKSPSGGKTKMVNNCVKIKKKR